MKNHIALYFLLASQNGSCEFANTSCCTWVNDIFKRFDFGWRAWLSVPSASDYPTGSHIWSKPLWRQVKYLMKSVVLLRSVVGIHERLGLGVQIVGEQLQHDALATVNVQTGMPCFIVLCRYCLFFKTNWKFVANYIEKVCWCDFTNTICTLPVSVSHFGNSRSISNFYIIILFIMVICDKCRVWFLMLLLQKHYS